MGPPPVVMSHVPVQDRPRMPPTEDQHPVADLGPAVSTNLFRITVRPRLRGGIFTISIPASVRTASNAAVNCPAQSPTRNRKPAARSPRSISRLRICWVVHGPSGLAMTPSVHVTGADLHDEQAVQALQGHRAVDMEEVCREHRRSLSAGTAATSVPVCRRGRDLQGLEDPTDGGCADPVAELEASHLGFSYIPNRCSRWPAARSVRRSRR